MKYADRAAVDRAVPYTTIPRSLFRALWVGVVLLSLSSCAAELPEEVGGFWFFSFRGRPGPTGEAVAYVTRDEPNRLGGGVASNPIGGPLSGRLGERGRFTVRVDDYDSPRFVDVEGRLRATGRAAGRPSGSPAARASGEWRTVGGTSSGSFSAARFDPGEYPPERNPFLGTWTDFADGGVTTLSFEEDFTFTGSEADLRFRGQYAFDPDRGLVGVYEGGPEGAHMELLTYRFTASDTLVLNASTYRRQ
jgi:hypothetical protein